MRSAVVHGSTQGLVDVGSFVDELTAESASDPAGFFDPTGEIVIASPQFAMC